MNVETNNVEEERSSLNRSGSPPSDDF